MIRPASAHTARTHACSNCDLLVKELQNSRVKAEQAFAELRRQTDKDVASMHTKLTARGSTSAVENRALLEEISRLQDALNQKTAEVTRWRQELQIEDDQPSAVVIKLNEEVVARERRNSDLTQKLVDLENKQHRETKKLEEANRSLLDDMEERDALISELKAQVRQLSKEIASGLTVNPEHVRDLQERLSQLITDNSKLVADLHDKSREVQTTQLRNQRLEEEIRNAENRLGGANQKHSDGDHARARVDLQYRKKLGEVEAQLRRAEIQNAKLQQEVQQLNDSLDVVCSESERKCVAREAEAAGLRQQLEEERRHSSKLTERSRVDRAFYDRIGKERPTMAATWSEDSEALRKSIRSRLVDAPSR